MRSSERDAEFTEYAAALRPRMLRAARLLRTGDAAGAEDLVQTTLTRLYVNWPKVRRAGNPVGYGLKALTNAFIDESQRAHRRREHSAEVIDVEAAPSESTDVKLTVLAALRGLPPRQRAVVVLRHWLDLDVETTAQALGCSTGTVKSQNAKALAHLRVCLGTHLQMEGSTS
ncbi:MAG: SigE family RNA polymerase sigma factor [Nocardioides sp.]